MRKPVTATDLLLDPTAQDQDASTATGDDQAPVVEAPPVAAQPVAVPVADQAAPAAAEDPVLTGIDGRLDALEARVTRLTGELGATGPRLELVGTRLDAVEASEVATAGRVAATDTRLDANEARLNANEAKLDANETRLDANETRLDANQARLGAVDGAVRSAAEQIGSNTSQLESLDGRLDALDERVAALQHHAADHDRALQDIARSIAVEVERHTSDALVQSQHSLQLAVNSIAHLALAMSESSRDITEDVSPESATALLDSFRVDLDTILAQLGFESLDTSIGDVFDPHRHRALKRVPTTDPAQDKAITRVIRDGYSSTATGRILLFADVEVSRHRAP